MKISDIEYLGDWEHSKKVKGGLDQTPSQGILLSSEDGRITLSENGEELFTFVPEAPMSGVTLYLEDSSNVTSQCRVLNSGRSGSICRVTSVNRPMGLDIASFKGLR